MHQSSSQLRSRQRPGAQEAASLLLQIKTSAAAMENAPVGPVVVSLVIKLLQLAYTAILEAGGPFPRDATLISKMINRTSKILHNAQQTGTGSVIYTKRKILMSSGHTKQENISA